MGSLEELGHRPNGTRSEWKEESLRGCREWQRSYFHLGNGRENSASEHDASLPQPPARGQRGLS